MQVCAIRGSGAILGGDENGYRDDHRLCDGESRSVLLKGKRRMDPGREASTRRAIIIERG